jgi:hypothetical protein
MIQTWSKRSVAEANQQFDRANCDDPTLRDVLEARVIAPAHAEICDVGP